MPSQIEMLGFKIPIILDDKRDDVWGEWDGGLCTITINNKASLDHKRVTLLHELIHGIDDFLGLNVPHKNVYALSHIIFVILRENPDFAAWLID